jgi:hypothetical protein
MVQGETEGTASLASDDVLSTTTIAPIHKHDDHPDKKENLEYSIKSIQDDPLLVDLKKIMVRTKINFNTKLSNITNHEHQKLYKNITGCLKEIYVNVHIMEEKIDIKNIMDHNDRVDLNKQIKYMKKINEYFYKIYKFYNKKEDEKKEKKTIDIDYIEVNEMIKSVNNDTKEIKNRFIKRNEIFVMNDNNEKRMNIEYERDFKNHLQTKINILDERLVVLQMKYNTYKRWYDRFNILIIIISSGLSVFEALRNQISDTITEGTGFYYFFNMVPITISSTITCTAAIIKFKKYQEKMENMQFTREKLILAISKLKEVQESLWFIDTKEFNAIKKKYVEDVFNVYNEGISELERHIKQDDYDKYHKKYILPKQKEKNDQWKVL